MDAPLTFGFRHALDAMDAALELEAAERALSAHLELDLLEAADAGFVLVDDLDLPAARLGVVAVHAEQIGGEQARLVAARSGANFHDDVLVVAQVFGQQHDLQALAQRLDAALKLGDLFLRHRRACRDRFRRRAAPAPLQARPASR